MNTQIDAKYEQHLQTYENLLTESRFILENELKKNKIKIHSTLGRIKNLDSLKKKAERLVSNKPFEDITDIVGLRVICLLRSDIQKIGDLIRSSFLVITEDDKIDGQEVSSFGYQSVHFLAKIKSEYAGPRYDPIKYLTFEIQVRTIAMDAWATVSHYLDYKSDRDVPKHMRKDFYALSGLFYVVDTHFEFFYQASSENLTATITRIKNEKTIEGEELNIDTLRAYLTKKITDHEVPNSDLKAYSELIEELTAAGYKQISEIDSAIDRGWNAFLAYEKKYPPANMSKKYNAIGVVRGLMTIVDRNYYNNRKIPVIDKSYDEFKHLVAPK